MAAQSRVYLQGAPGVRFEGQANGAITPGHLLLIQNTKKLVVHNVAGGMQLRLFALENAAVGKDLTQAYASGDFVYGTIAQPGDQINALVAISAPAIVAGDLLESAGDGTLRKASLATVPAITDSTGGTPSATFAAITAGGSYAQADIVAIKNALAEIAVVLNAQHAILNGKIVGVAYESVDNSSGSALARIRTIIL